MGSLAYRFLESFCDQMKMTNAHEFFFIVYFQLYLIYMNNAHLKQYDVTLVSL